MMRWAAAVLALMTAAPATAQPTGELVEGVRCVTDPTQTYTLYLPSAYDPERQWPVLLIFDPRGRSVRAAELFRDAAESYGWILVSSNDTRSDGPVEPNRKALEALWPEIHGRYAIDTRRIYAAGFSGGAMLAWALGRANGALAGVIGSGGRLEPDNAHQKIEFACYGSAGDTDFNYSEMREVHARLKRWGTPERLEIFAGPHGWMPAELAREAVEWMELQAMKEDRRERDGGLVDKLYRHDMEKAARLEQDGALLVAQRRYAAIVATFAGLRNASEAERHAKRLAQTSEFKTALKDEKRRDRFEQTSLARIGNVLGRLREEGGSGETTVAAARLLQELRISDLKQRARLQTYEGVVARRLLETVLTQTSFYLNREFFARHDYAAAVQVLTVAAEIRPERADVWYNLACARARTGAERSALEALERAVDAGYADAGHLESDADLESLRGLDGFRQIVARLRG